MYFDTPSQVQPFSNLYDLVLLFSILRMHDIYKLKSGAAPENRSIRSKKNEAISLWKWITP